MLRKAFPLLILMGLMLGASYLPSLPLTTVGDAAAHVSLPTDPSFSTNTPTLFLTNFPPLSNTSTPTEFIPPTATLTPTQTTTPTPTPEFPLYLPLLLEGIPLETRHVFGVEISPGYVTETITQSVEANIWWVRHRGIAWSEVETNPGAYKWEKIADEETEIRTLSENGLTPIVIIYSTPPWAQAPEANERYCGPIAPDALDDFANFARAVVARYNQPPYNVKYWELWNEPDVSSAQVANTSPFGCWGNPADAYYGGGYFAEMLELAYPAIKEADPQAQVVLGGLLLDCDPTHPPLGRDCSSGNFLEGILQNGGGDYLDIVTYHAYTYWSLLDKDWDMSHPAWTHRGGSLAGKLDFLQTVMAEYDVVKPLMITETSLLCSSIYCPGEEFYDDKANAVLRAFVRSWGHGLLGTTWYTLDGPGWREGNLLDENQNPQPAYHTLQFISTLLEDSRFNRSLSNDTLEGYSFVRSWTEYQVYWSNDANTTTLQLPPETRTIYDKFGQEILPEGTELTIGFDPLIIEIQIAP